MSDQLVTLSVLTSALVKFHAEVIAPDVRRIVQESEARLRNDMQGFHDSIVKRLGDLETESAAIKIGLKRVEERLDLVEVRLGRVEGRIEVLERRVQAVEGRIE